MVDAFGKEMKNNVCLKRYFLTMIAAVLCAGFASPSRAGSFEASIPEALRPKIKRIISVVLKRTEKFGCTSEEIRDTINREEKHMFLLIDEASDELFQYHRRGIAKLWVRMRMNCQRCRQGIPEEKLF